MVVLESTYEEEHMVVPMKKNPMMVFLGKAMACWYIRDSKRTLSNTQKEAPQQYRGAITIRNLVKIQK